MQQKINPEIWKEFEEGQLKEKQQKSVTINTTPPNPDSWTARVCAEVRISELAEEHGITECPRCHYTIYFNDDRGWFICAKRKYDRDCSFGGTLVDFVEFLGGEI